MIELRDIYVRFGSFEALHGINVDVKEGEDMLTAPAEEHQAEPDPESKPARTRKRKA